MARVLKSAMERTVAVAVPIMEAPVEHTSDAAMMMIASFCVSPDPVTVTSVVVCAEPDIGI